MPAHRILVLEDSPTQALLYAKILAAGRYEALSLADPIELVRGLDAIPPPDAILLDLILPEMDGLTVITHLQSHPRWCMVPVIVMTASPTLDRVEAAQRLPIPPEGFLAKPIDPRGMLQQLAAVIAGDEPLYLLRRLQRIRLSLRLSLRHDLESVEAEIASSRRKRAEDEANLVEVRRNLHALRVLQPQVSRAPLETRNSLQQKLDAFEKEADRLRDSLLENSALQKLIAHKRHEVLCKQRRICEVERQIQAVGTLVQTTQRAANAIVSPSNSSLP